jgi:hypothetical protein
MTFGRKNTISVKYNYAQANDLCGVCASSLDLPLVSILENFSMLRLCSHVHSLIFINLLNIP